MSIKLLSVVATISVSLAIGVYKVTHTPYAFAAEKQYAYVVREIGPDDKLIEKAIQSNTHIAHATLAQNGFVVFPEDRVKDALGAFGGVITVERAPIIHIVDGKKKKDFRSWVKTLQELVAEKGILAIGEQDSVTPGVDVALAHDVTVTIVRVQETDIVVKETVPFKTIEKEDANLDRGKTRIEQEGSSGIKELTYHVRREDGVEVSRKLTKTEETKKKQDKIVVKGTKLKIGRTYTGKSTWYECCGTKVASDLFKRGTEVRITNLNNGKNIIVKVDGCICGNRPELVVDLHPTLFQQLGGTRGQGVLSSVKIEEILN